MRILTPAILVYSLLSLLSGHSLNDVPFQRWTLSQAVSVLNDSPWARQQTFVRILGGIGSGLQGEKEIYNTFFVRFLSSSSIHQAYARIHQIQFGDNNLDSSARHQLADRIQQDLTMDMDQWIVVAVTFRSNDPNQESTVERFFQSQTTETLETEAYLSTERFPQLGLYAYYPPKEQSVGAKFVFPREVDGVPVVTSDDEQITFQLDAPAAQPQLRVTFSIKDMIVKDKLEI